MSSVSSTYDQRMTSVLCVWLAKNGNLCIHFLKTSAIRWGYAGHTPFIRWSYANDTLVVYVKYVTQSSGIRQYVYIRCRYAADTLQIRCRCVVDTSEVCYSCAINALSWPCRWYHTIAYRTSVCQRMTNYHSYAGIR